MDLRRRVYNDQSCVPWRHGNGVADLNGGVDEEERVEDEERDNLDRVLGDEGVYGEDELGKVSENEPAEADVSVFRLTFNLRHATMVTAASRKAEFPTTYSAR